jgi:hypothetical protein
MPYSDAQATEWEGRAPEPIRVQEPPGWSRVDWKGAADRLLPNERLIVLTKGEAKVFVMRFWDRPLHPGHPMQVASTRPYAFLGRELELVRTSVFEGVTREVEVLFVPGDTWFLRITFEGCSVAEIDDVCARIQSTA